MITQLLKILRESIKAVPAMKYALAVAGILAVVAMVGAFKLSPQMAVFGAVITLVLMVAMVIFARLTTTAPRHFFLPATIMMWAFLVVTVATAFLLFTSAFFHWPHGLRELIDSKPATPVVRTGPEPVDVRNLVAVAQQQRAARDYAEAWRMIGRAVAAAPESKTAQEEQLQVAMVWVRDMRLTAPSNFTETVRPLLECLQLKATTASGTLAADIHAHIGWANFLRSKESGLPARIADEYATAVAFDSVNPFAHAMWGHWLAVSRRPIPELQDHFQIALKSGRERAYVQEMRIAALHWLDTPESALESVRVADEMRRNQEILSSELRRIIYNAAYSSLGRANEPALLAVLPAADHLTTYRWILEGDNISASAEESYYLARLTEGTGDFAGAVAIYRALAKEDLAGVYEERVKAGLARCEQQLTKSKPAGGK